ncbi:MAG: hypothetical protein HC821_04285 [Lewinella sp.]|nr:hypothetical protein [Lewinella sp.]
MKTANAIFGTLLLLGAGVQLHFIFAYSGWLEQRPALAYLPIYYSLSLPVLMFYYVKFNLYPRYRLRLTDLKHFLLPLGQFLYLWVMWGVVAWRQPGGRSFYNLFYGGLEQGIFLAFFPLYLLFARAYWRARRRQLGLISLPRTLWYLRKLMKGSFFFFLSYGIFGGQLIF